MHTNHHVCLHVWQLLRTLAGLDNVAAVGQSLTLEDCSNLATLAATNSVLSIGNALELKELPGLVTFDGFAALKDIDGQLQIRGRIGSAQLEFRSLARVSRVEVLNTTGLEVLSRAATPYQVTQTNALSLSNNADLKALHLSHWLTQALIASDNPSLRTVEARCGGNCADAWLGLYENHDLQRVRMLGRLPFGRIDISADKLESFTAVDARAPIRPDELSIRSETFTCRDLADLVQVSEWARCSWPNDWTLRLRREDDSVGFCPFEPAGEHCTEP